MAIALTVTCGPCRAGAECDGNLQVANVGSTTATITVAQVIEVNGAVPQFRQPALGSVPTTTTATIAAGAVANFPFAFVVQGPVMAGPPSQNVGANHSNPWGGASLLLQATVSGTDGSGNVSDTAQCSVAVNPVQQQVPSLGGAMQFNATGNSPNYFLL